MTCRRCGGLMVVEPVFDDMDLDTSGESQGARCLNCGNLEDAVIYANRQEPRLAKRTAHDTIEFRA